MKSTTLTKRFAATGVATALAAGALVGASSTVAQAAPEVTNAYTCSVPGLAGPYDVMMETEAVGIEGFPQIGAGAVVPPGLLTVTNHATIPAAAYGLFTQFGVDNVTFPDFGAAFGQNFVGVDGMDALVADMVDNGDGTYGFQADGINDAFEAPAAGQYQILMPANFTMNANNAEGELIAPIVCDLAEDAAALHNIEVTKNDATVTAKAPKKVKKGKVAKVVATVGASHLPTGKVLLKRGKKTVASSKLKDSGSAVLKTKKLKPGKNKLTVVYKGDGYTKSGTSETFVVKVTR